LEVVNATDNSLTKSFGVENSLRFNQIMLVYCWHCANVC
jgi:hypothetical protein